MFIVYFVIKEKITLDDIKKLIGQRIRELRLKKGLKQSELAEIIGLEPRSISRIESGYHFPKDEHLLKFAYALGVNIKELFAFSHIRTEQELKKDIIRLLKNANSQQLTEIYRIIEVILS